MLKTKKGSLCEIRNKIVTKLAPHYKALHTKECDHVCPSCGKGFITKGQLKHHALTHLDKSQRTRPWKCNSCEKSFLTSQSLRVHNQAVHLLLRPFGCELCSAKFKTSTAKSTHLIRIHTKERPHPCSHSKCGKSFINRVEKEKHEQTHSKNRVTYNCLQCDKKFFDKYHLAAHISFVHGNSGILCSYSACKSVPPFVSDRELKIHLGTIHRQVFNCSQKNCEEKFKTKEALTCHLVSFHEESKRINWLQCPFCKINSFSLKDHLDQSHMDREKGRGYKKPRPRRPCPQCDKSFANSTNLNYHIAQVHNENGDNARVQCEQCGKSYSSMKNLNQHLWKYHPAGGQRAREQCPLCPSTLGTKAALFTHLRVHTGERPYKCGECSRSFRSSSNIAIHRKGAHNPTTAALIPCLTCGMIFQNTNDLGRHTRINHVGIKFGCYFCAKLFTTWSSLRVHMVEHTLEEPYKCDVCFNSFLTTKKLATHKLRHSGIRGHGCYFCGKSYLRMNDLRGHLRGHTREKIYSCPRFGCNFRFTEYNRMRQHGIRVHDSGEILKRRKKDQ